MIDDLSAAQVTGVFSVLGLAATGVGKFWYERRKRKEARRVQMEQYIGPLIHAASNLQGRMYRIVADASYAQMLRAGSDERYIAYFKENTSFLIAQYMAWAEIIRTEVFALDVGESESNKRLSGLMDEVYEAWQSSEHGPSLRIFAGEQRAIGEAMMGTPGAGTRCAGYGEFLGRLERDRFLCLLHSQVSDMDALLAAKGRMRAVQHVLIDMLTLLDPKGNFFAAGLHRKAA